MNSAYKNCSKNFMSNIQKNNQNANNICSENQQHEIVVHRKWAQTDKTLELPPCLWFVIRSLPHLPVYLLCMMMPATVVVKRATDSFHRDL